MRRLCALAAFFLAGLLFALELARDFVARPPFDCELDVRFRVFAFVLVLV
ncbi:MAG: hypothetical protein ACJ74L_13975 [Gaiellaceae bacterium]